MKNSQTLITKSKYQMKIANKPLNICCIYVQYIYTIICANNVFICCAVASQTSTFFLLNVEKGINWLINAAINALQKENTHLWPFTYICIYETPLIYIRMCMPVH